MYVKFCKITEMDFQQKSYSHSYRLHAITCNKMIRAISKSHVFVAENQEIQQIGAENQED